MKLLTLRLLAVPLLALRAGVLCAGVLCMSLACAAQDQQSPPEQTPAPATGTEPPDAANAPASPTEPARPKPQFFAGIVTTVDAKHIVVSRTLVGKAPESRTFLIQAKTKLSRTLKPRQRVTVRYQHLPEGDVALEVQIRQQHAPKTS